MKYQAVFSTAFNKKIKMSSANVVIGALRVKRLSFSQAFGDLDLKKY
ncbi:MAG: hypothetical protein AB2693_25370 [Candidatus Thiodiazotropha sp.]